MSIPALAMKVRQWMPARTPRPGAGPDPAPAPQGLPPAVRDLRDHLDTRILMYICEGDPAAASDMFSEFLETTRRDLDDLAGHIHRQDREAVEYRTHRIQGASAMIGAAGPAVLAGELQEAAHRGEWEEVRVKSACLERLVEELAFAFKKTPGGFA